MGVRSPLPLPQPFLADPSTPTPRFSRTKRSKLCCYCLLEGKERTKDLPANQMPPRPSLTAKVTQRAADEEEKMQILVKMEK